jgi:hypothetical protein
VLTLHPQAAVEHLHHLFVAAGGEGSDALIAIEATEQTSRASGRPVPASAGDAYGDLPGVVTEPVSGGVGASLLQARGGLEASVRSAIDRLWDAMPRRKTKARGLTSRTSKAETQRRGAIGAMALVGVVLLLGLFVILGPSGGDTTRQIEQVAGGDSALTVALDRTDRADNLISTEPDAALDYYREAWEEVERARATGLTAGALDTLESRVRSGLDTLYGASTPVTKLIAELPANADPGGLVRGPLGAAYFIDGDADTVTRVNTKNGKTVDIVHEGDKPAAGGKSRVGRPVQLEAGGPDVVVIDDKARPWRWRPSSNSGSGTLNKLNLIGSPTFGQDHGDVAAYSTSGGYRLYVVEPSRNQIMRYQQTFDGSSFQVPTSYLVTQDELVGDFDQLYVDFDVYALVDNALRRYQYEKYDGAFAIDDPPDATDIRPDHDYQLVAGPDSSRSDARIYLYDAEHGRIVGFSKVDGSYIGQWIPAEGDPQMDDVRGMYVVAGKKTKKRQAPDKLVWVSPDGVFESILAPPKTDSSSA